jgi:tetratricopeptide (TPR) repeat protein
MTFPLPRISDPQANVPSVRLDSWKEIAAYLGKVERTVKRWETERALPVHRPPGGRGSVYAFTFELDQWLKSAKESAESDAADTPGESANTANAADLQIPEPASERLTFLSRSAADVPSTSPVPKGFAWYWRIPIFVLLPVCLVLAADFVVHRRAPYARASTIPNSQFDKTATAPLPAATTDEEKRIAHDLYLQGRFEWNKRTADSLNRAQDLFTQAIVHDPSSAQNYAGLSETYILMHEYSLMPNSEGSKRAIAAGKKAVELDDSLAEAHRALAFAEVWGNWDFQKGERDFRRAIELDPRDPLAHLWFAIAFAAPGWYPVSLHEFDRAQELDPTSPATLVNKSMMLFETGKMQEGVELARRVEGTNPDFLAPHRYLAVMHWSLRDYPAFLSESEKLAQLSHDPVLTETTAAAKAGYLRAGERGLLSDLYEIQKKLYAEGKLAGGPLERTCIHLGKREEALHLLERDYEWHNPEFLWLLTDVDLRTLKDEPRYRDLVNQLHFPTPLSIADLERDSHVSNSPEAVAYKHP